MKTLDRYVATQFLKVFGICVVGAPFIFILIGLTDRLDTYLAEGVPRLAILEHYVFQFPYQSLLAFPIASLLAAVFTVSSMTRHFEVTAAKAGGVSFYRLTAPLLVLGLGCSAAALGLTEIVPTTNRMAADALGEDAQRRRTARSSFVYRGREGRVYRIEHLEADVGEITGVHIEREGTGPEYPTYLVTAISASWDSAARNWTLYEGRLRLFPRPGGAETFRFDELRQKAFTEPPARLLADPKEPDQMDYEELGRFIEAIERSGGDPLRLRVERQLKIAFPFTCVIIVLFGAPLANSTRRGGTPVAIGVALATTVLFLIIVRIAQALGAGGLLPPLAAAWFPNGVFLSAGALLYTRVRT